MCMQPNPWHILGKYIQIYCKSMETVTSLLSQERFNDFMFFMFFSGLILLNFKTSGYVHNVHTTFIQCSKMVRTFMGGLASKEHCSLKKKVNLRTEPLKWVNIHSKTFILVMTLIFCGSQA